MRKDTSKKVRPSRAGGPGRKPGRPRAAAKRSTPAPRPSAPPPTSLSPEALRDFLDRQIGRPWNKVFQELSAGVGKAALQEQIAGRLDEVIIRRVTPVPATRAFPCGLAHVHPELGRRAPVQPETLYVDPRDGVIKLARRRFFDRQTPGGISHSRINATEVAVKLDGVWLAVTVRQAAAHDGALTDVLLGEVSARDLGRLRERYGREVVGVSKRQLSDRELRNLGLANDPE